MKRALFILILLCSFGLYSHAQSSYIEVVYLKNGSMIKGVIIEQIPNVSLKIKTADGSIFVYKISEVEKITKEETKAPAYRPSYRTTTSTSTSYSTSYQTRKQARRTLTGYKGFIDAGYTFDLDDYYNKYNMNRFEISTSHGYQFNNYFFIGGGVAFDYYTDAESYAIPVFANFRANFINKKVTPFGDFKLGYTAGDIEGVYMSMAVGVRITMAKKSAINFRLEYTCQGIENGYHNYGYSYGSYYYYYDDYDLLNGFGFKIGFEF